MWRALKRDEQVQHVSGIPSQIFYALENPAARIPSFSHIPYFQSFQEPMSAKMGVVGRIDALDGFHDNFVAFSSRKTRGCPAPNVTHSSLTSATFHFYIQGSTKPRKEGFENFILILSFLKRLH